MKRLNVLCCATVAMAFALHQPRDLAQTLPVIQGPAHGVTIHVAGEVRNGKPFVQMLRPGLFLRISTTGISILPRKDSGKETNFAGCSTPPWHGPNSLEISAWHFEPEHNQTAPSVVREFQFTTTVQDNQTQCDALKHSLYDYNAMPPPDPFAPGLRLGTGKIRLFHVVLSPRSAAPDLQRDVRSFAFSGTITLPRIAH